MRLSSYKPIAIQLVTIFYCGFTTNYTYSQYSSSFEEAVFSSLEESEFNSYDFLNAIEYDLNSYDQGKSRIQQHVADLKSKNLQNKSLKKQIKTIYKSTHAAFLTKYDERANFNDIFKDGSYNCVTASALYALIFDEFKINYSIREKPTHIYLIADTAGLQTLIESTLPGYGVVNYNEKFKKDFINYLHSNKIISDQEYKNQTIDEIFASYYSKDKSINLKELAAIQYFNEGVFLMVDENYIKSVSSFNKARSIYPSTAICYNHGVSLQNALYQDFSSEKYDGKILGEVLHSCMDDSSLVKKVSDYFEDISKTLCIHSPDIGRFNKYYTDMLSICPKEKIPNKILFNYHSYRAYYYGVSLNHSLALKEIIKAYNLDYDNIMVKDLAQSIGAKHLFLENDYKSRIDSMDKYFLALPFLTENKIFQQQYTYYCMKVIVNSYMFNQPEMGKRYYDKFLDSIDKYDLEQFSEEHIGNGFGYMAFYYADKFNFKKANEIVDQGLELAPYSMRLQQIKSEIKANGRMRSELLQYEANNNSAPVRETKNPADELKEDVNEHFPGTWKAVMIIIEDMEQSLTSKEKFEFVAKKNKDCIYTHNGKLLKGKWAYRKISRCIYFVPDHDKDQYMVFKVKEASAEKIILLPYKDQKTPSPYWYVLKPG